MARRLRDLWWEIRLLVGGLTSRLGRWVDPLAGTDEVRYKSSKEIALENAAESLGANLGDYYLQDWEVLDFPSADLIDDLPSDIRARGDAAREEILVYVDRVRLKRHRRRGIRRKRLVLVTLPTVLVFGLLIGAALSVVRESPEGRGSHTSSWSEAIKGLPLFGPNGQLVVAQQPAPIQESVSLEMPGISANIIDSAYISQSGTICSGVYESVGTVTSRNNAGGCLKPDHLQEILTTQCATFHGGGGAGGRTFIVGFAHKDVVKIVGRAPRGHGPLQIRLSELWIPKAPGIRLGRIDPVRAFMVTARIVRYKATAHGPDSTHNLNPYTYKLTARLANGQSAVLKGFLENQVAIGPGCGDSE